MPFLDLSLFYALLKMFPRRLIDLIKSLIPSTLPSGSPNPRIQETSDSVLVDESSIPTASSITLPTWEHPSPLPSPSTVRAHPKVLLRQAYTKVLHFEDLNLVVKYGKDVHLSEARAMWLVPRLCSIRCPKIYGWCQDKGETFIYSEYIKGDTVASRMASLSPEEKLAITSQLREMVASMRRIRPDPEQSPYIGSLLRDIIHDCLLENKGISLGPFLSVQSFNEEFCAMGKTFRGYPNSPFFQKIRDALPSNAEIVFSHSDLHPGNVLVSGSGESVVVSIIDWGMAGWRPEWWEVAKAYWAADPGDEWTLEFVPLFLDSYDEPMEAVWMFNGTGLLIA